MTLPRHAKTRDLNEPEIIAKLENDGYAVWQIDVPCDLLVGQWGRTHLVEIKNPEIAWNAKRLTKLQQRFRAAWIGKGCIHTGTSYGEILQQILACTRVESG